MLVDSIAGSDVATALLGVEDNKAVVCALVLDALYTFRKHKTSIEDLAYVLKQNEAALSQCDAKMEGVVDALREYQLIHPIHHTVMDQLCSFVENECVGQQPSPKVWIRKAFVLLGTNYDEARLTSLLNLALGPFPISQQFVDIFLDVIEKQVCTGMILDKHFAVLAGDFLERVRLRIARRDNGEQSHAYAYLMPLETILSVAAEGRASASKRRVNIIQLVSRGFDLQLPLDLIESCTRRISRVMRVAGVSSVVVIVILVIIWIGPYVKGNWGWIEPYVWLFQTALSFAIVIGGYVLVRPTQQRALRVDALLRQWLKSLLWDKVLLERVQEIARLLTFNKSIDEEVTNGHGDKKTV